MWYTADLGQSNMQPRSLTQGQDPIALHHDDVTPKFEGNFYALIGVGVVVGIMLGLGLCWLVDYRQRMAANYYDDLPRIEPRIPSSRKSGESRHRVLPIDQESVDLERYRELKIDQRDFATPSSGSIGVSRQESLKMKSEVAEEADEPMAWKEGGFQRVSAANIVSGPDRIRGTQVERE